MYILIVSFTDRAVDRSHTRQTDIHFLGRIIGFHGAVDMGEHGGGRFAGGVIIAFFQVDIHTAAPRVLFHYVCGRVRSRIYPVRRPYCRAVL